MVLTHDTLSCRDDRLCQIISKSYQFSNKVMVGHDSRMQKLKVLAVTLTFDLATWFLYAIHCLVLMNWGGHDSGFLNPLNHNLLPIIRTGSSKWF